MDTNLTIDEFITVDDACRLIGGTYPISRATYYRQVQLGRFPTPVHPSPGISRIRKSELFSAINAATGKRR